MTPEEREAVIYALLDGVDRAATRMKKRVLDRIDDLILYGEDKLILEESMTYEIDVFLVTAILKNLRKGEKK